MTFNKVKFGDFVNISTQKTSASKVDIENYISTENMLPDCGGITLASGIPSGSASLNAYEIDDTLFSNIRTYFRKVWLSTKTGGASPDVLVFSSKDPIRLDPHFLYYVIANPEFIEYTDRTSKGAKMPRGDKDAIKRYEFLLPSIGYQKEVASTLKSFDDRISLLAETNKTLELIACAIFKSWFINFDPVNSKSEGKKPEGIADEYAALFPSSFEVIAGKKIPSGWTVESIYEIANVTYGAPFSSKLFKTEPVGKPLVRIRDLKDEKPGVFTEEVHPKGYLIKAGDIVVGMDGEFRAYIWGGDEAWLNQRVCVFHPTKKSCAAYVRLCLMPLLAEIEASETATTVIHLGKNDIDRFKIILPSQQVLSAFSELIDPLYKRLVSNKRQIQNLSNLRDTLLPRLISGQLSVVDESLMIEV